MLLLLLLLLCVRACVRACVRECVCVYVCVWCVCVCVWGGVSFGKAPANTATQIYRTAERSLTRQPTRNSLFSEDFHYLSPPHPPTPRRPHPQPSRPLTFPLLPRPNPTPIADTASLSQTDPLGYRMLGRLMVIAAALSRGAYISLEDFRQQW